MTKKNCQMRYFRIHFLALAAALILAGCHSHSHEHGNDDDNDNVNTNANVNANVDIDGHHHGHAHEHAHQPVGSVVFSHEMQAGCDFAVSPVQRHPLGNVIHAVAQVQQAPGDETVLAAHVPGIVRLTQHTLTEGCGMTAGQALCTIDASATVGENLTMRQQQAEAEATRARAELKRLETLRRDKLVLESEVREARAAAEKAEAELKAVTQGLKGGRQTVSAPRAGFLKQMMVSDGQFVETGQALAVITSQRTLQLKAEIPLRYAADLPHIADAVIDGRSLAEDLQGRLLSYGRQVSEQNPRLPVTFEVANTGSLIPGSFVDINIVTRSEEKKLCVPASAIIEHLGLHFVFVRHTAEVFVKRQVQTGSTDGRLTEIKSGLTDKEQVVSRGAMLVLMQQSAGNMDPEAGHHH